MFNKKKRYFKRVIADTDQLITQLEFAKYKAIYAREKARKQHDRTKEALSRVSDDEKGKKDKEVLTSMLKSYEDQLREIDAKLTGSKEENQQGIDEKIEGLVELRELTKHYIKNNI